MAGWVLALAAGPAWAGAVGFAAKPTATADGDGVRIDFAVTAPADVEVAIVDAKGAVVRHLAAGVLGAKEAAPPLAPGALKQSIRWDRKDDGGKLVTGATTVRVRVGTQAVLAKVIDRPEQVFEKTYGLATDDEGNLYAATGGIYTTPVFSIKVFDRRGKYQRTVLPFPASLTAEQAAGFGSATEEDGHLKPGNFNPLVPYMYNAGIVAFVGNRVREGALWLVNTEGRLSRIGADGRCLVWKDGPKTAGQMGGPMCWAVAPGGKALYLAGLWDIRSQGAREPWKDGVVHRVDPDTGKAEPFVTIDTPGNETWTKNENGWYHFTNWGRKNGLAALHGLAVDEAGQVYVCDRINQRLAVYSKEGQLLGSTAVEFPDLVGLGREGAVYVSTRRVVDGYRARNEFRVLKLSTWKNGKVVAETTLEGENAPSMAVDATTETPVIWLSNVRGRGIVRIEDRGAELVVTGALNEGLTPLPRVVKVWADPETDEVYVNDGWSGLAKFNGETGRAETLPITAIDLAVGPDRNLYLFGRKGWSEPVYRCDREFKPVPFSGTEKPETGPPPPGGQKAVYGRYGTGWSNKDLCVTPDGRIYIRHMYDWAKYYVTQFGPDGLAVAGNRVAGGVLGPVDADAGGIRVDREGNFYLGMHGHPAGAPAARTNEGCIVKFLPSGGGRVAKEKDAQPSGTFIDWGTSVLEGAMRVYPHLAPMAYGGCVCKEARFDLDGFGRLYLPNVLDFNVTVVDNAGNVVVRFGHYGNADSRGEKSAVPKPAVPLGWPMTVSVNRQGHVYVGDVLNQRLVRVDLTAAATEACPVP